MPRTALFMEFEPPVEVTPGHFTQAPMRFRGNSRFTIDRQLGKGSYGVAVEFNDTADTASSRGARLVAKFPHKFLKNISSSGQTISEALLEPHLGPSLKDIAKARKELRGECTNAEAILDPPYLRELNPDRRPGEGYSYLGTDERAQLERETQRWRAKPGYSHLHQVLHFDERIPMLISRRAEGTLQQLRSKWGYAFKLPTSLGGGGGAQATDPAMWRDLLGRQLGAAVGFILSNTSLAHMDIKPDNILYTTRAPGVFNLQLSDYGLCFPKAARVVPFGTPPMLWGTATFVPPADAEGWSTQPRPPPIIIPQPPPPRIRTPSTTTTPTPTLSATNPLTYEWPHNANLDFDDLLALTPLPPELPVAAPVVALIPSNQTLSLFQYYAVVMGCLVVKDGNVLRFIDAPPDFAGCDVYRYVHASNSLKDRMHNVSGRKNSLFLNAMAGILSENPEMELLARFRNIHTDLAINCECPY